MTCSVFAYRGYHRKMSGGAPGLAEVRAARILEGFRRIREAIPRLSELDPELGQRLRDRVELLAGDVESRISGHDGSNALHISQPAINQPAINQALTDGEGLLAEALAFVTAAAASWLGLGGKTISLAQAWLDRLSRDAKLPPVGLVVPASSEYTGMQSRVIRLLMPDDGIWGLPVAIHEYGHFVGSVLARRTSAGGIPDAMIPVEKVLYERATADERPKLYWHGHELFADAFAAAVAGPAYTRYCIEYRFDPRLAHADSATHPSPDRRIGVQLRVLEALCEGPDGWGGYLKAETADLRKTWEALLAAQAPGRTAQAPGLTGQAPEPAPANPALDELQQQLIEFALSEPQIRLIHYGGHTIADELSEKLHPPCPPSVTPAIIINAAWIARRKLAGSAHGYGHATATLEDLATRAELLTREACTRG